MTYVFDVEHTYPDGIIPRAIYEAQQVNPCDEIKEKWQEAIIKDVNNPDIRFSWRNFINSLLP